MIRIPENIYQKMIEHAKREWPFECCGILGGKDHTAVEAFELQNIEKSPIRYSMSPKEQWETFEKMERQKIEMIATYHSHPNTTPFPSETDVKLACYPDIVTIIISLKEENNPIMKAFRIEKDAIYPEEIVII